MQTLILTKKYEKYPEYKDSGVEWLGKIPKDWKMGKVKEVFDLIKEKSFNNSESEVLSLTLNGIKTRDVSNNEGQIASSYEGYRKIYKGDIVLNPMDLVRGFVDASKYEGIISPAYSTLRKKNNKIDSQFYNYFFQKHYFEGIFHPFGNGVSVDHRWTLKDDTLVNFSMVIPTYQEQEKIAKYLDEKTSYIDRIIENKQKLIEFLKEKRTAVINNAVTKGLNSKAELVESGIEWIDIIPKKWKVKKLKFLGEAIIGLTYSPEELVSDGSGTLVLRSSNVQDDKIVLTDNVFVNKTIPKKLITKVGDILICSRNGSRALIGKNALIDDSSAGLSFGAFMTVFRTKNSRFISYFLKSNLFMSQLSTTLTSTINQLTTHYLNNITAIIPPEKEQEEIVDYLDKKVGSYNKAIQHAEDSIEKLREFKSSLISNVVTGKIKV